MDEEVRDQGWEGLGVGAELTVSQGQRSPRDEHASRDSLSFLRPLGQQKAEGEAGIMDSWQFFRRSALASRPRGIFTSCMQGLGRRVKGSAGLRLCFFIWIT